MWYWVALRPRQGHRGPGHSFQYPTSFSHLPISSFPKQVSEPEFNSHIHDTPRSPIRRSRETWVFSSLSGPTNVLQRWCDCHTFPVPVRSTIWKWCTLSQILQIKKNNRQKKKLKKKEISLFIANLEQQVSQLVADSVAVWMCFSPNPRASSCIFNALMSARAGRVLGTPN